MGSPGLFTGQTRGISIGSGTGTVTSVGSGAMDWMDSVTYTDNSLTTTGANIQLGGTTTANTYTLTSALNVK